MRTEIRKIQSLVEPWYRKYGLYLILLATSLLIFKPKKNTMKKIKTAKVEKVMKEFREGKLHSASKKGPEVTNPKQAVAIGLSEARKAGAKIPKKGKK